MSLSIGPSQPPDPRSAPVTPAAAPPPGPEGGHGSAALMAAFQVDLTELVPASPPIELQKEVQFAAQRAAQLAADDRELHFTVNDETGKVVVQVRDLEGNVIRTIPNAQALDVMAGRSEVP